MALRKYPIGCQDFADIRTRKCVYVDKTEYIYKLSYGGGKTYFLSRPRRFGKSLLLSTMRYYFEGRKELFEGLKIAQLETEWIKYPVISISFAGDDFSEKGKLASYLNYQLSTYEKIYKIEEISDSVAARLKNIIIRANEITGRQAVVLIDEYDKPVLDALYSEAEERNRTELRGFYSPLKDCDQYIKFLFITGITKITHVNIFSGLNQLDDISLNESYAAVCGISESELEEYFEQDINALAESEKMSVEETKQLLARRYDGYHFTPKSNGIYNPFCLLKCFSEQDFGSYWFETGTPTVLVKTLQHQPLFLANLIGGRKVREEEFKNYDPETKNMLPVVYQSGYLTIKGFEKSPRRFILGFPNQEVEEGFLSILVKKFAKFPDDDLGFAIDSLTEALNLHDVDTALRIVKAAIADLPTVVKKDMCENYYESITHIIFRLTGFSVVSELQGINGRSDVILTTGDSVFIFELKMDKGEETEKILDSALIQIDDKGYADRFAVSGKQMFKVGVVFSSAGKGLLAWKVK